ncbi:hypothetical protein [Qipengyuania sediminis]|uniref:hypothetical protein n=1 Tax=Qipengyuania sediminis TaxID=1532023 RepID=UPI0010593CAD|nr:hypothetical protein [Qipengyuania sediminis]
MSPLRSIVITLVSASALAGCTTLGLDAGYYDDDYHNGGYYDRGYESGSYYGWYGDYYYPGTGYYVYDRGGRRHAWNDWQRRFWEARRAAIRDRRDLRDNWSEFRRDRREDRRDYREERRENREDFRRGEIDRREYREERREDRKEFREERREDRREFRPGRSDASGSRTVAGIASEAIARERSLRESRQTAGQERREARQEARQDRREARQGAVQERRAEPPPPARRIPRPTSTKAPKHDD